MLTLHTERKLVKESYIKFWHTVKEETEKIISLVLWAAFISPWFCPTTFPHLPPRCALIVCFSLCLCHLQWRILKIHSDGPCCSAGIMWCCLPGFLGSHCAAQVARCKFHEFKRVIRQNSLVSLLIDALCQHFSFSVFLKEFALCHYPVKLALKYIMAMRMSNIEQRTKIALAAVWSEWFGVLTSNILNERRVEEGIWEVLPRNCHVTCICINLEKCEV